MILVNNLQIIKHFCNNSKLVGFPQKRALKRGGKKGAKWPDRGGMVVPKEEVMVLPKIRVSGTPKEASGGESRSAPLPGSGGWCQVNI